MTNRTFENLEQLAKEDEDIDNYFRIARNNKDDLKDWIRLADLLSGRGYHQEAMYCFDRVLEMESGNKSALLGKGILYARLGEHLDAIKYFDMVLTKDDTSLEALINKGLTLSSLGRLMRR